MEVNLNDIDIERLRSDLISYFEGAYFVGGFGAALMDISEIERANSHKLVQIAINNGFDLDKKKKKNIKKGF